MIRGTTPTIRFWIPSMDEEIANSIEDVYVNIFSGYTMIEKSQDEVCIYYSKDRVNSDGSIGCYCLSTKLIQEETLKLKGNNIAEIQVRIKFNDGTVYGSNIFACSVNKILKDGSI